MDKTKPNCSLIGEGAYLTREVADPISSGTFWIKLKETSNNLSIGSLSKIKFKTNHIHVNFKKNQNTKSYKSGRKKLITHSPIAAGSAESLLWLTFNTVSWDKFLRSSFIASILLWAKISFCSSTFCVNKSMKTASSVN